jgi:hypothetical protein
MIFALLPRSQGYRPEPPLSPSSGTGIADKPQELFYL